MLNLREPSFEALLSRQCSDQTRDLVTASQLSSRHPGRVLLVKYEEVVTRPEQAAATMLEVSCYEAWR